MNAASLKGTALKGSALNAATSNPDVTAAPADGTPFPLSHLQRRLWLLHTLDPTGALQSTARCFQIDGRPDLDALQRALDDLVERHEPLRTVFPLSATGEPVQLVLPAATLPLTPLDAEDGGEPLIPAREFAEQPFAADRGPLARAGLLRTGPDRLLLVVAVHLLVADGWSWNVLLRELGACYAAALAGTDPQLPGLPLQYADWAHWQHGQLTGARRHELRRWWQRELDGAAPGLGPPAAGTDADTAATATGATTHATDVTITTDTNAGATVARPGRAVTRSLDARTEEALRALARREGVSLFAVLAAAFGATTGRRIRREKLVIGTPVAHRDLPETEHLLGFLVGTLPLRVDLTGDPPFTELAHRLATTAGRAFAHKDLPWEELPWQQPPGGRRTLPTLAHHPAGSTGSLALPGCRVSELDLPSDASRFDLTLRISEHPGPRRSSVRVEHDTRVVPPVEADDLLTGYLALLDAVARRPTARLSELLTQRPRPSTN
ncbi:condensation domain-containing protein [Kitasatospora indigofera]|uniref:condensation domain-containing protein n=1 Tax=Kitasatospora indigofera TaxID=67307 RepID=UPI003642A04B